MYDYDFKYGENFYICVTEGAKELVLNVSSPMETPPDTDRGRWLCQWNIYPRDHINCHEINSAIQTSLHTHIHTHARAAPCRGGG